jgi:hypothetical protein
MWPIIATSILVTTAQITNSTGILFGVAMATYLLATFSFLLFLGLSMRRSRRSQRSPSSMRLRLVSVVGTSMMLLGGVTITEGARLASQSTPETSLYYGRALKALGIAVDENSFAIGILLILLGGFVLGAPSALVFKPPLPRVKLEIDNESSNPSVAMQQGSNSHEAWLVAHSDGFWHLFLDESGELQSIPDGQVRVVRTRGKGHTPPEKKDAASSVEAATSEEEAKPGEVKSE